MSGAMRMTRAEEAALRAAIAERELRLTRLLRLDRSSEDDIEAARRAVERLRAELTLAGRTGGQEGAR